MSRRHYIWIALLSLAIPAVAAAQASKSLKGLVDMIVGLLNSATVTLVALALVVFLFGVASNMWKSQEHGSKALSTMLVWGIGILFLIVSIWGVLRILQQTLFGSGSRLGTESSTQDISGVSRLYEEGKNT